MRHEPEAWKKSYREDGFVIVEDLLSPATLDRLRAATSRVLGDMTGENGATLSVRGSHLVPDEEARQPRWRKVDKRSFHPSEIAAVRCPAGSAIFFNTKTLHAAGHNRSEQTRHTLLLERVGPDILPTSHVRYAYQGLKPRSADPAFRRQMTMTFPETL